MTSIVNFIRALLRLDAERSARGRGSYPECEPLDRSRPLYIGRGIACLGRQGPPPPCER